MRNEDDCMHFPFQCSKGFQGYYDDALNPLKLNLGYSSVTFCLFPKFCQSSTYFNKLSR